MKSLKYIIFICNFLHCEYFGYEAIEIPKNLDNIESKIINSNQTDVAIIVNDDCRRELIKYDAIYKAFFDNEATKIYSKLPTDIKKFCVYLEKSYKGDIICYKDKLGRYMENHGMLGFGIRILITIKENQGFKIYGNCQTICKTTQNDIIYSLFSGALFHENCRIKSGVVDIFYKRPFKVTYETIKSKQEYKISTTLLENSRGQHLTTFNLGPTIYSMFNNDGTLHELSSGILMQFIKSISFNNMLTSVTQVMIRDLNFNNRKLTDATVISIVENESNRLARAADAHEYKFKRVSKMIVNRYLNILSSYFALVARKLNVNISHCDFHGHNIIMGTFKCKLVDIPRDKLVTQTIFVPKLSMNDLYNYLYEGNNKFVSRTFDCVDVENGTSYLIDPAFALFAFRDDRMIKFDCNVNRYLREEDFYHSLMFFNSVHTTMTQLLNDLTIQYIISSPALSLNSAYEVLLLNEFINYLKNDYLYYLMYQELNECLNTHYKIYQLKHGFNICSPLMKIEKIMFLRQVVSESNCDATAIRRIYEKIEKIYWSIKNKFEEIEKLSSAALSISS